MRLDSVIDLDANFSIGALRGDPPAAAPLEEWIEKGETIAVSAVAWSELLCGPLTREQAERAQMIVSRIDPLTGEDAILAAELFNQTGRRPRSLTDCMIAAIAIRRGATLATFDRTGFSRFVAFRLQLQTI